MQFSLRQALIYSWWLLVLLPLFSVAISLGSLQVEVPLEPVLGLQVIGLITYLLLKRPSIHWQRLDSALVLFVVVCLISVVFSYDLRHAGKAWIMMLAYILGFYGSYRILNPSREESQRAWNVCALSFALLAAYSLINVARFGVGYHASYDIAQPFSVGHTLLIASGMPAFLYVFDRACRDGFRWFRVVFLALVVILILVSFSRMYWPVLPVVVLLYGIKYLPRYRKALTVVTLVTVIGGLAGIFALKEYRDRTRAWEDPNDHKTLSAQITSLINLRANDSNLDRLNRWKIAWLIFEDHPVTGGGLRNYQVLFPEYPTQVTFYSDYQVGLVANAHSLYLGWLADLGVLGTLAGLILLVIAAHSIWRYRRHPWAFLGTMLLVNFLALGVIEDFLLLETIAPYWWLSLGVIATQLPRSGT